MKKLYVVCVWVFTTSLIINAQVSDYIPYVDGPQGLAIAGTDLYFSQTTGTVSKADLNVDNPTPTVIVSGIYNPIGLDFYGDDLYIADFGTQSLDTGKVLKVDITSPTPTIVEVLTGLDNVVDVKIHDDILYFSTANFGNIYKYDLTIPDPTPTPLVSEGPAIYGIEIYNNELYYLQLVGSRSTLRKIDLNNVSAGYVIVVPEFTTLGRPVDMRLIGTDLFIPDFSYDKIFKLDLSTPNAELVVVVSEGINGPRDCIGYGNKLYFSEVFNSKISVLANALSVQELNLSGSLLLYPNPSVDAIYVSNLKQPISYTIYNTIGQPITQGLVQTNESICIADMSNGIYYLQFEDGHTEKFIKR